MKKILFSLLLALATAGAVQAQDFLTRHSIAQQDTFRTRVRMAALSAAGNVLADTARTYLYPYAGALVMEPTNEFLLQAMVYQVLGNPVINAASSDNDIQFTVNSVFEKVAIEYAVKSGVPRDAILAAKRQYDTQVAVRGSLAPPVYLQRIAAPAPIETPKTKKPRKRQ